MDLLLAPGRLAFALAAFLLAELAPAPALQAQSKPDVQVFTVGDNTSYLGIEMEDVTSSNMATYKLNAERGVIVRAVQKGSPAEAANLHENDVILEYAGMPVFSSAQFARMVRETPVGRTVEMVVSREGKKINLSAKIGERKGSGPIGRGLRVIPDERGWQGFNFEGPEGRSFSFRLPEGRAFALPDGSSKPRLGIEAQSLTPQMADFLGVSGKKGVLVVSVTDNSPASGKLKAGDVILSVEGQSVDSPAGLSGQLMGKESGAKVDLRIVRDKKEMTVTVELSKTDQPAKKKGIAM